jgi:UDP-N-acetylmuramoylalanine-D-glutamate ligase
VSADVYAISEVNTVVAELNEIVVIVTGTNGGSITDMVEEMQN